jgi:integrase
VLKYCESRKGDAFCSKRTCKSLEAGRVCQKKPDECKRKEGAANSTINRETAVLSHVLNKAEEWKWLGRNDVRIHKLTEDNWKEKYLTGDEIARVLRVAESDDCWYIQLFLIVSLGTAMRMSEVLMIKISDISFDFSVIDVPKAKAGARKQPMTPWLTDYLRDYVAKLPSSEVWLFPSETSESGHMISPQKAFHRVVNESGLKGEGITIHTLRHTAITNLVQTGTDLLTVMRFSGHKTLVMVQRYSHQNDEHIKDSLAKLDARYSFKSSFRK